MNIKIATVSLVLASIFMASLINVNAQIIGLAVSPSNIVIDNALRGGQYEQLMTIFNGSDNARNFSLGAMGDLSHWFSFYAENGQPENLIRINGQSSGKVIVRANIPEDVANENYDSSIHIESIPEEGGTPVVLSYDVSVVIEVTGTQILTGIVQYISFMKDTVSTIGKTEVNHPLSIYVRFLNTGNVIAKPKISIDIRTLNDFSLDNLVYENSEVLPGKVETIEVSWDSKETPTDNYTALVNVALEDNIIKGEALSFEILPEGALSRRGELLDLSQQGKASVGIFLKILALFKNTGEIPTNAMLVCEIYRDGGLIDVENSPNSLLLVGEEKSLTTYVKVESYGNYLIKGYVIYEGKTTDTKELSFSVVNQGSSLKLIVFLAVIIVVTLPTAYVWNSRRKKLRRKS
jgi:hypothetical protein